MKNESIRTQNSNITSSSFNFVGFVLGPTAVGKTEFSFYLAEKCSASILNCDSIQMYKDLDIGSAKPVLSKIEKKISMFMFNEWYPPFVCTAGIFRKKALSILKEELSSRSVLAVGGSGFYIQALERGMYPVKSIKPEIKAQVKEIYIKRGLEHLYKLLCVLDSKYAAQISSKDTYRIFRAMCIILSEEKPLSFIKTSFQEQELPWPYFKIGLYLPRDILLKKVQIRTAKMIKDGLLEEVQGLLNKGLQDWPIMKSVGYGESVLFLQNKLSKDELQNHIISRTMRLVKKQMSWFKRDKSIQWYLSENKNWLKIYNDCLLKINILKRELSEKKKLI